MFQIRAWGGCRGLGSTRCRCRSRHAGPPSRQATRTGPVRRVPRVGRTRWSGHVGHEDVDLAEAGAHAPCTAENRRRSPLRRFTSHGISDQLERRVPARWADSREWCRSHPRSGARWRCTRKTERSHCAGEPARPRTDTVAGRPRVATAMQAAGVRRRRSSRTTCRRPRASHPSGEGPGLSRRFESRGRRRMRSTRLVDEEPVGLRAPVDVDRRSARSRNCPRRASTAASSPGSASRG